jgi:hypothetical protein
MVLAACEADQLAWEMPNPEKGSVLTYHILALIDPSEDREEQAKAEAAADTNGDGKLSFGEVYQFVKDPIRKFVKESMDEDQIPVLLDNANDSVILVP